jgi:hypothetical protein
MLPLERDEFIRVMSDLCVAFNRPWMKPQCDDIVRVYWEALRGFPLPEIKSRAKTAMLNGKKFPSPADLKPLEDPPKPANTYVPTREFHPFERTGNFCLFRFISKANPISDREVFPAAVIDQLVREKDKIVRDFIAMQREEKVEPRQVVEALERTFKRITATEQREAA